MSLLVHTRRGLYCPAGDFYIDPSAGVERAVLTHAHADHARRGSRHYFAARSGALLLRERLGRIALTELDYGQKLKLGDAWISLHPAGHILGSAQVRIEVGSAVWVVSGDYKRDDDPTCEPFEVVACDTFVTEATFAMPFYRWPPAQQVAEEIHDWWQGNAARGRASLLLSYSLGKTQRLLAELGRITDAPIYLHPSAVALTECYRGVGIELPPTPELQGPLTAGSLAIVPPMATRGSTLAQALVGAETAFVSGWLSTLKSQRQGRGFVMSDHADWPSLVRTVQETGAQRVYVMHGDSRLLVRYLRDDLGLDAHPIEVLSA